MGINIVHFAFLLYGFNDIGLLMAEKRSETIASLTGSEIHCVRESVKQSHTNV